MSSDNKRKIPVAGYIAVAVILTAIATVAGLVISNHASLDTLSKPNTNQTNTTEIINTNGNVNLSEIGNVTDVKILKNGTYQLTVSKSKENAYKNNILNAIKKDAGAFSQVCSVQITTKDDNESRVVYEKPNSIACLYKEVPPPVVPPPVVVPPPIVNETPPVVVPPNETKPPVNETKPPVIIPPPARENQTIKLILTGDIGTNADSTAVFNAIKKQSPDNVVVLGDLGYASDLKWFKSTYGTLGNKLNCVIGNHDSASEDGTAAIEKEAKAYCANDYYFKKNHVLFFGFNTNGNLNEQAIAAGKLLTNTAFMNGIKSVHIMSHKPCAVAPNAHHPLEIKAFCDAIKSKIPAGVKAYYDQAHNHVMSASADGTYKTVGSGGKSHYTCGVSPAFPFCDNAHFGYLQYVIKPDGTTTTSFVDYNGKVLYSK